MRTCMLHLSSVVVFFFNHNILFYYAYVFHTSQHMCDIACVPIGKHVDMYLFDVSFMFSTCILHGTIALYWLV